MELEKIWTGMDGMDEIRIERKWKTTDHTEYTENETDV